MFSMSTCGELTSVPQRRHLAGLFVLLAGCSFFQQYSAVQLHQVTAATNRIIRPLRQRRNEGKPNTLI